MSTSWDLIGNLGTVPGQNFLGTQDTQPLVISTYSVEKMRITADGNVGIGTGTPSAMLDVRGQVSVQGPLTINHAGMTGIGSPGDTRAAITFGATDTPAAFYFGAYDANTAKANTMLGLYSYQLENWLQFWSPNGNVGIGTAAPAAPLDIAGGMFYLRDTSDLASASSGFKLTNVGGSNYIESAGAGMADATSADLHFTNMNARSTYMTIKSDGNVNIGGIYDTATAYPKLTVAGPDATTDVGTAEVLRVWRPGVMGVKNNNSAGFFVGAFQPGINGASRLDINVAGAPSTSNRNGSIPDNTILSLLGDGNVGIGTTTPNATLTVNGDVSVTGDVVLTGADCAEEFDIAETAEIEPGMVVVFDQGGVLHQCRYAYDTRVAGVISGAGDYQPGLILDRRQSQESRMPLALVGKVYCKVDAQYSPIEVGDLLTTSQTPGHAMKALEPTKTSGAVIGKALGPLAQGQGLIPILVALQ